MTIDDEEEVEKRIAHRHALANKNTVGELAV